MLGPGVPVFEIVDISGFKMTIKCSEDEITNIYKGMGVKVKPKSLPNIELNGKVSKVSVSADIAQQYTIEIYIDKSQEKQLKGGMVAIAEILGPENTDIIAVSKSSIFDKDGQKFVYKVIDQTAIQKEVLTGISFNNLVEIKSGLESGDLIVKSGINLLTDGKKIKIVE